MINSAKYAFVIILERQKIKKNYRYSKPSNLHLGSLFETKQKANKFDVMSAAAFCYKASPALAQYLLILVSMGFQCFLG